jgi:hypothetical protein
LLIAGSVDYRQALLRVIIPFEALAWAYKYTEGHTNQTQTSRRSAAKSSADEKNQTPARPTYAAEPLGAPERPGAQSSNGRIGSQILLTRSPSTEDRQLDRPYPGSPIDDRTQRCTGEHDTLHR